MKFNVGNRVEHEFYGKGTVIGVSDVDTPLVEFDNHFSEFHDGGYGEVNGIRGKDGHCWYTDMIKPLKSQTIVVYPKGLETIALLKEGKKVIKQATAKCNPSDTYDFNIGAKLAFSRLVGGIYIGGVDMAIDTIREVKRPAKVGEWIKVVNAHDPFGCYSDGDIFKVLENGDEWAQGAVIVGSASKIPYINSKEYVVLENYQPEETIRPSLSIYTDKELINELSRRWEDKK